MLILLVTLITSIIVCSTVALRKKHAGTHNSMYSFYILFSIGGATGVIDHVPVDDNPAYITMKRITLNKNTAYETVNMKDCHYETVTAAGDYETVDIML